MVVTVDRRIVGVAVVMGLGLWVLDAALDAWLFFDGTVLALLVTDVPVHELYIRTVMLGSFLAFGLLAGWQSGRVEARNREAALFRELLDEASDSVFVIDPQTGAISDANETAAEMLGYDREALLDLTVADINPQFDDAASFVAFTQSDRGEQLDTYETVHERADGTTVPVEISAATVTVEGEAFRIAIVRDVSDRRERERRIRHYQRAVESSTDMLTAVDRSRRYLFANPAYCSFHDLDVEAVRGEPLDAVLDAETLETVEPHLDRAFDGETVHFEMRRTRPGRGERTLEVTYFPIREDGDVRAVGASLRDVTRREQMIRDLRTTRQRYESL
ncbi:MAG: PAS domain-containing protein, partial [Haloglomus sp.]